MNCWRGGIDEFRVFGAALTGLPLGKGFSSLTQCASPGLLVQELYRDNAVSSVSVPLSFWLPFSDQVACFFTISIGELSAVSARSDQPWLPTCRRILCWPLLAPACGLSRRRRPTHKLAKLAKVCALLCRAPVSSTSCFWSRLPDWLFFRPTRHGLRAVRCGQAIRHNWAVLVLW
jgi:hypothetical protein